MLVNLDTDYIAPLVEISVEEFVNRRHELMTLQDIASKTGIHLDTIKRRIRCLKVPRILITPRVGTAGFVKACLEKKYWKDELCIVICTKYCARYMAQIGFMPSTISKGEQYVKDAERCIRLNGYYWFDAKWLTMVQSVQYKFWNAMYQEIPFEQFQQYSFTTLKEAANEYNVNVFDLQKNVIKAGLKSYKKLYVKEFVRRVAMEMFVEE